MPQLTCARTLLGALLLTLCTTGALAQQDRAAERAARRQQQQLQTLQEQVTQAQAEKTKIDQDRAAIAKQLQERSQAAARASTAQRAAAAAMKALEADKEALTARVAELEKAADVQRQQADQALAAKDRQLAQAAKDLGAQVSDRDQWQQRFGEQARLVTECSNKNDRLVKLSAELLDRWQGKGVFDALRQREPVLGFNDVQIFNLVQDYRDKTDNERFVPRVQRN
jgi:chromosome segregation ATPase